MNYIQYMQAGSIILERDSVPIVNYQNQTYTKEGYPVYSFLGSNRKKYYTDEKGDKHIFELYKWENPTSDFAVYLPLVETPLQVPVQETSASSSTTPVKPISRAKVPYPQGVRPPDKVFSDGTVGFALNIDPKLFLEISKNLKLSPILAYKDIPESTAKLSNPEMTVINNQSRKISADLKPGVQKGMYVYRYPHNQVNVYKINPQDLEKFKGSGDSDLKLNYVFLEKKFYKPGTLLNDTVFYDQNGNWEDLSTWQLRLASSNNYPEGGMFYTIDDDDGKYQVRSNKYLYPIAHMIFRDGINHTQFTKLSSLKLLDGSYDRWVEDIYVPLKTLEDSGVVVNFDDEVLKIKEAKQPKQHAQPEQSTIQKLKNLFGF